MCSKQHDKVLRDIREICHQAGLDFAKANFGFWAEASKSKRGKPQPLYLLTKDGLMLLGIAYRWRISDLGRRTGMSQQHHHRPRHST